MGDTRRKLRLDGRALLEALVARDEGLLATYVDLEEGGFVRLYDPAVTGRDNERVLALVDADPDRYGEVPPYTRTYRLMAEFVDTVEDDHLARLIDMALSGKEAFRRFDAVLAGWPAEQARWRSFRQDALARWAAAWLRSLGVEPDWELPIPPEAPADVPDILLVALRGAAAAPRTRTLQVGSEAEARALFQRLARQLCELRAEPFRARRLRGSSRFARGAIELRYAGHEVTLTILE